MSERTRQNAPEAGEQTSRASSSLGGSDPIELASPVSPADLVASARSYYAAGDLASVIRTLIPVVEQTTPAGAAAMSAWSLLARARDRTNEREMSAAAAGAAVSLLDQMKNSGVEFSASELGDAAIASFLAGRIDDADEWMSRLRAQGAVTAEMHLFEGLIYTRLGRPADAESALAAAAPVEGDDFQQRRLETLAEALAMLGPGRVADTATACHDLANIHYKAGRYPEALAAIERALALMPQHVDALAAKGDILRLLGNRDTFPEALASLEEALRIKPDFAWALASYGELLRTMDRLPDAAAALSRAVELEPGVAQWHSRYAEVLRVQGHPEDALARLDIAMNLQPDNAVILSRRGEVLRVLRRYEEALADLNKALALQPDDLWTLASKGETLRAMGRTSEAEPILRRILKESPDDSFAAVSLGYLFFDRNLDLEALGMFERAVKEDPGLVWAWEGKAHTLLRLDRSQESLDVTQKLLELQPDSTWARNVRGLLLYTIEKYQEAAEQLEESIKLDPDVDWAQNGLAVCYQWLSRIQGPEGAHPLLDKAVAASTKALALAPDDLPSRGTLAETLWLYGDRRVEADAEYQKVLEGAQQKEKVDFYSALEGGWAAFRLAASDESRRDSLLEEAERLSVEALTQKHDRPASTDALGVKFNLALVLLCSERFSLALREYDRTLSLALENLESSVHRGLVGRTRIIVQETMREWPQVKDTAIARKVVKKLEDAYAALSTAH